MCERSSSFFTFPAQSAAQRSSPASSPLTRVSQRYAAPGGVPPIAWSTPSKLQPLRRVGTPSVFIPHRESHSTFLLQLLCGDLKKKERKEKNPNRRAMCFGFSPPLVTIYRISPRSSTATPPPRPSPSLSHKQQPSACSPHADGPI